MNVKGQKLNILFPPYRLTIGLHSYNFIRLISFCVGKTLWNTKSSIIFFSKLKKNSIICTHFNNEYHF